jgi:hypothetical protein
MKEKYEGIFFRKCNDFFELLHILENNECIPENLSRAKAHISASAVYVSFQGQNRACHYWQSYVERVLSKYRIHTCLHTMIQTGYFITQSNT